MNKVLYITEHGVCLSYCCYTCEWNILGTRMEASFPLSRNRVWQVDQTINFITYKEVWTISSCDNLEAALKEDGKSDIDANELYMELKFIQDFMPKENMGPIEILKFLKWHDSFPNTSIKHKKNGVIQVKIMIYASIWLPAGRGRIESSDARDQGRRRSSWMGSSAKRSITCSEAGGGSVRWAKRSRSTACSGAGGGGVLWAKRSRSTVCS
jgi:hypothetical protein